MTVMQSRILLIVLILMSFISCGRNNTDISTVSPPGKGEMEELNRYMIQKDRERIISFIERKGLSMTESPTGLWFQVISEGQGKTLNENMMISMEYACSLLDGTLCYSSEQTGPKEVLLGRTGIEPGLYEGLKMLRNGAEAYFILPPFLAHGLPGDGDRIPPRSVIVYKVKILRTE